jgi:predicted tellurium resistance membrane protein TerC
MTNNIPVIVTAILISMIVMLLASEKISYFLQNYPSLKIVALAFIFMIGVILLADGLHMEISKSYLYFSLFFTIAIESLNIVARRRHTRR